MISTSLDVESSSLKNMMLKPSNSRDKTSYGQNETSSPDAWKPMLGCRIRKVSDDTLCYYPKLDTIQRVLEAIQQLPVDDKEMEFNLLSRISNIKNIGLILTSVLESPGYLQEQADKSYRHENGFSKLVITSSKTHSLRLHIYWNDSSETYQENIHNHRWDFSSCILKGCLVQDFFEVIDAEEAKKISNVELMKHYIYNPLCSPDKQEVVNDNKAINDTARYQTTFVRDCFVRKKSELALSEGFSYHLRRNELHRIRYTHNSDITITLVLYTAPYNPTCDLYSVNEQYSGDSDLQHKTKNYTTETFKRDLLFARNLISNE